MGSHFAAVNNRRYQAFIGAEAIDRAVAFAGPDGAVWAMSSGRARRLGLSNPITAHELSEVCIEADTLIWSNGKYWTITGNRPAI